MNAPADVTTLAGVLSTNADHIDWTDPERTGSSAKMIGEEMGLSTAEVTRIAKWLAAQGVFVDTGYAARFERRYGWQFTDRPKTEGGMVSKPGASTVWGISTAVAARLDAGETAKQIVEEAMRMRRNDRLPGGRADRMHPADFDPEALATGTKHELEHTSDRELAREIAMDHLAEDEAYYEKLEAMERASFRSNARMSELARYRWEYEAWRRAVRERDWSRADSHQRSMQQLRGLVSAEERRAIERQVDEGVREVPRYSERRGRYWSNRDPYAISEEEFESGMTREAERLGPVERGNYWVWVLRKGSDEPMDEGPYGPHSWESAKTFARIGATEGEHDRAVSRGREPDAAGFEIVRIYEAGSGEHIVKATPNQAAGSYTVREENTQLGSAHFRGTFPTLAEAEDYARRQAQRSRNFVYFEVWIGTPRNAIKPVGKRFQGGG